MTKTAKIKPQPATTPTTAITAGGEVLNPPTQLNGRIRDNNKLLFFRKKNNLLHLKKYKLTKFPMQQKYFKKILFIF